MMITKIPSERSVPLLALTIALYASFLPDLNGVAFKVSLLILTISLFPYYSLALGDRQSTRLTAYSDKGFIKRFFSGIAFRILISIFLSTVSAMALSVFLSELTTVDWVLFILAASLAFGLRNKIAKPSDKEFNYPYSIIRENLLVKVILSGVAATGSALVLLILDNPTEVSTTMFKSDLLQEMVSLIEAIGFLNDSISMSFINSSNFFLIVVGFCLILLKYALGYFLLFSITDCLTLPRTILWKTVSGIEFFGSRDTGAKHGLTRTTAITVLLSLVVWLEVIAGLEYMADKQYITEHKGPIVKTLAKIIDLIVKSFNGEFYEPSIIKRIWFYAINLFS